MGEINAEKNKQVEKGKNVNVNVAHQKQAQKEKDDIEDMLANLWFVP